MRDWKPLPDPHKPKLPYIKGFTTSIRCHIPPRPFGLLYTKDPSHPRTSIKERKKTTQSDWCILHPPQETEPCSSATTRTLEIVEQLRCGDNRGAQIVCCHLDGNEEKTYVAKIYDPLYYNHCDDDEPVDVAWEAESSYSSEAAAYQCLCTNGVNGQFAPEYFGSWTFDLDFPAAPNRREGSRPVRLILIDYIEGKDLRDLMKTKEYRDIDLKMRLKVAARVLENITYLEFYGVYQRDYALRNYVVDSSTLTEDEPKVYIIDFNISYLLYSKYYKYPERARPKRKLPMNPMCRFWSNCGLLDKWLPRPYCVYERRAAFRGWLKKTWEGSEKFILAPKNDNYWEYKDEPTEDALPEPDLPAGESDSDAF